MLTEEEIDELESCVNTTENESYDVDFAREIIEKLRTIRVCQECNTEQVLTCPNLDCSRYR